ncbi:MAG: hypothetical protein ACR2JR_06705, partial [Rubrobacteraceae bacterium]
MLLMICSVALLLALSGGRGTSSETPSKPSSEKSSPPEEQASGAETSSEKSSQSGKPASGGFFASGPMFQSLDQMVATADLVVMGTVTDARPGEVMAAGTPDEVRNLNAVVNVDEVLKGPVPNGPIVVKTLELGYTGPGKTEWRQPKEPVLLFLSDSRETPGLYIMAGISYDQTAYIRQADGLAATVRDPVSNSVASLSVPELRREVDQAKA